MESAETTEARQLRIAMPDGVVIAAEAHGDPAAAPVILLHGGGQTRHAWKGTAAVIAEAGYLAIAMDHRGHGESGWSPDGSYALDRFAGDLRGVIATLARPPVLIGASLGGMTSLIACGESTTPIARGLVLVDVAPRFDEAGVARIRGFMREHLADGFARLEDAAEAIAGYLPHRARPKSLDGLAKNLRRGSDGRWRWHWDPAFATDAFDADPEELTRRLLAAARHLRIPSLLVRGSASEVVTEEAAREYVAVAPQSSWVDVGGARHMVAGDVNDAFTSAVMGFLAKLPPG